MYWNIVRLKFDWGDIQTQADIAERVGCDQSTVSRTMSRWNDTGNPIPGGRSSKGASRRLGKLATAAMILMVENNPDMYIREIRDELQIKVGHLLSFSKICRALRDNKFSVKVLERIAKERDAQVASSGERLFGFFLTKVWSSSTSRILTTPMCADAADALVEVRQPLPCLVWVPSKVSA